MASSAQKSETKLSAREQSLLSALIARSRHREWVSAKLITDSEYGLESRWPLNARQIVTGTMIAVTNKLDRNKDRRRIIKRGGGRAGIEYKLENRK